MSTNSFQLRSISAWALFSICNMACSAEYLTETGIGTLSKSPPLNQALYVPERAPEIYRVSGNTVASATGSLTLGAGRMIRIMPFGDSITSGPAYRQPLWDLLKDGNYLNIDFVGSLNGNSKPDGDHEGHACYKIVSVLLAPGTGTFKRCTSNENSMGDFRDLDIWFAGTTPDIVLWHMGTNDAASSEDPVKVMRAFSATLTKLRQRNPKVTVLVAKILPMAVANVGPINSAIPGWAASNSTPDSKVILVDMNTGFDQAWTYDGIHPNAIGGKWMAARWFSALKAILG